MQLTFVPLKNPSFLPEDPSCEKADDVDACALYAAGCVGPCSGTAVQKLINFISCFEGAFPGEGQCKPENADKCVKSAGLDASAYGTCAAGGPEKAKVDAWIKSQPSPGSFPYMEIAGSRVQGLDSEAAVRDALCSAGVKPACTH